MKRGVNREKSVNTNDESKMRHRKKNNNKKKTTKTKHERWAHEIGVDGFFFWFFFGFFLRNEIFHVFHFSGPFFLFSFDFSSSFVATGGTMSFVLRPAAVERLTHCGGQSRWP